MVIEKTNYKHKSTIYLLFILLNLKFILSLDYFNHNKTLTFKNDTFYAIIHFT